MKEVSSEEGRIRQRSSRGSRPRDYAYAETSAHSFAGRATDQTEGGIESQGSSRRQQWPGRNDFRETRRARGKIVTPTAFRVLSKKWQVSKKSRALSSADLVSATKGDNPFETSKSGDRPFMTFCILITHLSLLAPHRISQFKARS